MGSEAYARRKRWLRFLLGGGVNTAFTYALYLALNTILAYQLAYFIAYALGVVFAYWFNAAVVFRVPLSWKGLCSYPVVYLVHYLVSAFLLGGLVELAGIVESLAPLVVALVMVPVTYVMSKFVLEWTSHQKVDQLQERVERNDA
ncbi:MAG: hypothetical protein DDT21_02396 [Syntrophomonadaceae bacterium]|nr:hypothetical protein [Bacillota bacterium]